ncbi:Wzz/FepE/Etk N-terminal domain-containing protein [Testudinibacter aquarius]|uniref:Lipopolysaccharide biosynthesis protein WzzE n=1 Tax=Testudinibacter aquarius TaxID=1524974 RepID=A0A4R3YEV2_9PAST|nr:Wzz/FepE/Etk N-terminal domain-containing protein [Testudinibacter aquarius]KAE9529320.1 hypothetical protein A1D24_01110 [Testudinibacter aquarius]TCV89708.1 lipopolysaccharide biosynthesis protein WzzE [Testudinibacter aquarius]TNG91728.1 hypothetical protein FHQ21_06715 [Testudinibacter aquarius]
MSEYNPSRQHAPQQSQQIEQLDLLAFVTILWRKSWLILLLMGAAAALAYVVTAFVVKPSWRAEAYIEAPRENELGNYYALYNMYNLISADSSAVQPQQTLSGNAVNAEPLTLPQSVYQQFVQQVKSYDVLKNFWLSTDYYKQMMNGDKNHDDGLLESLITSVNFVEGNARNNSNDKIELTLNNPKQAAELLTAFVTYANITTRQTEYTRLISQWKTLFDQVNLAVSNKLEQDQRGNIVPASVWQSKLAMMTSVQPLDNQFSAFHYLKTPAQPLSPSSPNAMLWILAAAFAALLLGSALAIILALRQYAASNK